MNKLVITSVTCCEISDFNLIQGLFSFEWPPALNQMIGNKQLFLMFFFLSNNIYAKLHFLLNAQCGLHQLHVILVLNARANVVFWYFKISLWITDQTVWVATQIVIGTQWISISENTISIQRSSELLINDNEWLLKNTLVFCHVWFVIDIISIYLLQYKTDIFSLLSLFSRILLLNNL